MNLNNTEEEVRIIRLDTNMTKPELVNVLAILLDMDAQRSQLSKMSLPALSKMYDSLNKNASAYGLAKQENQAAKTSEKIAKDRCRVLEAELRKLRSK